MASGGGMSRSLVGSSDVIHDYSCSPCAEDGRNNEAVNYCKNCDKYFCQTCVTHHNKVLQSHKLLDKQAMATAARQIKQGKGGMSLPTKECAEHPGNTVQMFCGTHDICCCTVCIALEHRECKSVDFIPKLAKGILTGKEGETVKSSLEKARGELLQIKSEREAKLSELKKTKEDILEEIQQMKESIIVRVEELERKSRDEVCKEYEKIAGEYISHIESINDLLKSTESQIKGIDQKQGNEAEAFVAVTYGRNLESTCNSFLQKVKQGHIKELEFAGNEDIETLLTNLETFGTVKITDYAAHTYSATLIGEYDVKVKEDKSICQVFDVCILDDDQYIITDCYNDKIKRLDKTFKVTDWCEMPGPWGVCKTDTNELAVTLCVNRQVQFVTDNPKIECTRSFNVGEECRGIACKNNKLIICCGGPVSNGEIRVYDLSGLLLNQYKVDTQGKPMFSFISHVVMCSDKSLIHLADYQKGLVTFYRKANRSSVFSDPSLKSAYGLCTDDHGNFFLSGRMSHNVIQFDRYGILVKEILKHSHGLRDPISVTFATKASRLFMTFSGSNAIKVFKLTYALLKNEAY